MVVIGYDRSSMGMQGLWFAIGLTGLYYAAEWLVRGSSRIARAFGVTPIVVGMTVVAFGTSAPELVVSAVAAVGDQSDVAVGNVLGSNIMNIALILGICALMVPIRIDRAFIRREIPIMIAVAFVVPVIAWDGWISRFEAFLLVLGFVVFTVTSIRSTRLEPAEAQDEFRGFEETVGLEPGPGEKLWFDGVLVVAGILGLVVSAHLLVTAAVFFAREFGVSELVVGLTIVAVGTSLPELATSIVAARRNEPEIALGNVVGSNICNVLLILGVAAAIRPISVAPSLMRFEIPVSIAVAVVLVPLMYPRARLGRFGGAVLVLCYVAFTVVLLWQAQP
ncbi:MAG TPA: calcium/sodium antiporter [Thermoanaerobaculia bacterium]|nr:calcium/sodium antiporter [Thermoanaerobaculia bacterium]